MKYGFMNEDELIVIAADTMAEFEQDRQDSLDVLDVFFIPELKDVTVVPYRLDSLDETVQVMNIVEAIDRMRDMILHEELHVETFSNDRRTLGEVHGLVDNDPWAGEDDEDGSRNAMNEQMKKIRDAGGLTDDSFGSSHKAGVSVGGVKVTLDDENNVKDVNVSVMKSIITPYSLIGPIDFDTLLDVFSIPENRVEERTEDSMVVRLHSFQVKTISQYLEREGVEYSLTCLEADEEDTIANFTNGDTSQSVYFCAVFDNEGLERTFSDVIAQHEHEDAAWYVFLRRAQAVEAIDGTDGVIVATNNTGKPIIGRETGDFEVIDTRATVDVIEPRPWNDQWDATKTDKELAEIISDIPESEYIFCVRQHGPRECLVHITPMVYFKEHQKLWDGHIEIPFRHQSFFKRVDDNSFIVQQGDRSRVSSIISRLGYVESIGLHLFVTDMIDDARIGLLS